MARLATFRAVSKHVVEIFNYHLGHLNQCICATCRMLIRWGWLSLDGNPSLRVRGLVRIRVRACKTAHCGSGNNKLSSLICQSFQPLRYG